jgi:16S rRNA U1498 N3-methylase RsmE
MNLIVFEPAEWGRSLAADDERAVHIREVLRLENGDALRVGLLGAGSGQAICRGLSGGHLILDFPSREELVPDSGPLPLTVLLGQPRPPVMQRLLKDLGALGVARILVVASELSEKSYMQSRLWQGHPAATPGPAIAAAAGAAAEGRDAPPAGGEAAGGAAGGAAGAAPAGAGAAMAAGGVWRRHLVAGAQQGGHCFLSAVERHYSVRHAIDALDPPAAGSAPAPGPAGGPGWRPAVVPPERRLVLDLDPDAGSFLARCADLAGARRADGVADTGGWCLAIGPERGWSERERGLFRDRGFAAFGLGPRILRTETATILATGMLALALQEEA